jgi:protein required for attachment to host cells
MYRIKFLTSQKDFWHSDRHNTTGPLPLAESGLRGHHEERTKMDKTWILIANGHRARCFERVPPGHALSELSDFVFPQTDALKPGAEEDRSGDAGKGHGRTGHAGTQFEPRTETHAKQRASFARQLADHINQAVSTKKCSAVVLIAPSAMLGQIRPALSPAARLALRNCVDSDLTRYQGADLKERVDHALRLPD